MDKWTLGCTYNGATYCREHCVFPERCEEDHGWISSIQDEWDYVPGCDVCHERIEGVQLTSDGIEYEESLACGR